MTFYTASFETVILRFFLMMTVIIGAFLSGYSILAVLGLPIFLSAMMAVSFTNPKKNKVAKMKVSIAKAVENGKQAA